MHFRSSFVLVVGCVVLSTASPSLAQTDKDKVGFTQLALEEGGSLEDGAGLSVGIVEAPDGSSNYLPNTADGQFSGKTITNGTPGGSSAANGHATSVGRRFFGNTSSMSPGVTSITGFEANDWIGRVLGFDTDPVAAGNQKAAPLSQSSFAVMNHSYIGNGNSLADATEMNRRLDLVADRDNVTMIVGANNSGSTPQLFAHAYNNITVGLTDGGHSTGATTFNGSGRFKPDIVAPHGTMPSNSFTSFSTPFVSSAATVLRHKGNNMGGNAALNEVTKAVLLAGATKDEFGGWSNSPTQPLDSTFGAGELNIYNSYNILDGGEFNGTSSIMTAPVIPDMGWDYVDSITTSESLFYNFDIVSPSADASIILNWNVSISDSGGVLDYDTMDFANLDLQLYNSAGGVLGSLVAESISTVDNVEHLYLTGLATGEYSIAVQGISGTTDYALAWNITAVPEPSTLAVCFLGLTSLHFRRRKRA